MKEMNVVKVMEDLKEERVKKMGTTIEHKIELSERLIRGGDEEKTGTK
jgi:hypothetical protein